MLRSGNLGGAARAHPIRGRICRGERAAIQRRVPAPWRERVRFGCASEPDAKVDLHRDAEETQDQGSAGSAGTTNGAGASASPASAHDPAQAPRRFTKSRRRFRPVSIAKVRAKQFQKGVFRFRLPIRGSTLRLGVLFASWYLFNIYFNVYNKRVLNAFPFPVVCTTIHLAVASACMLLTWATRMKSAPKLRTSTLLTILPLGVLHLAGFVLTNASLGSVAVSFTHTIKALEPFFTAVFSAWLLGTFPSALSMLALVPIVGGVILASFTEASFTWAGLLFALGSNFAFQLRNVLSKQYMSTRSYESLEGGGSGGTHGREYVLDQINLFACITLCACALMLPCVFYLELPKLADAMAAVPPPGRGMPAPSGIAALQGVATLPLHKLGLWSVLAGLCRTGDVLVSYAILAKVSPVTHSVGNCLKRVVAIAASIVIFQNPVSSKNLTGTVLAITGVFLYSMTKRMDLGQMRTRPVDSTVRKFSAGVERILKRGRSKKEATPDPAGGSFAPIATAEDAPMAPPEGNNDSKGPEYYL